MSEGEQATQVPLHPDGRSAPWVDADDDVSVLSLVNTILRHRGLILSLAAAGAVLASVIVLLWPRSYTSTSSFMPQSRRMASALSGLAAQFGLNLALGDGGPGVLFYSDFLESREVLAATVDTRYSFPTDTGAAAGTLVELFRSQGRTPALRREAAIKKLGELVTPKAIQRTGVVNLSVNTRWAPLSHQICQRMLELVNRFNLETRQTQAAAERRFAETRMEAARHELRRAEDRLQGFLQRNRDYRNSPTLTFEQERLSREVSLRQTVYTTLIQAFEQARIEEVRDTPVITVVEPPHLPVRPDSRKLVLKALGGLFAGALAGVLLALGRAFLSRARDEDAGEFAEFALLRQELAADLLHPWRPLGRLVRRRPAGP